MFREKDKANDLLRFAIRMCQGGCCKCPPGVRLSLILRLKDDLAGMGAVWQVKTLKYWINRFLKEHKDALQGSDALTSQKSRGVSKKVGGDVLVWYRNIP